MDERLGALKDEIDKILSTGPIGHWSTPPNSFPFMNETVLFNADGSGLMTSWSALSGKTVQAFAWSMEARGRLIMRYGLTRYALHPGDDLKDVTDAVELSPIAHDIEIKVQETDLGAWPVMTSEGRDTFDCLWTALARDDPPLVLQTAPVLAPRRSLLSWMRNLVSG